MQNHKLKFHLCCFLKYHVRQQFLCTATTNFPAVAMAGKMPENPFWKEIDRKYNELPG
jgi:hypothetical protein